jgi:hypothetical protein
VTRLRFWVIALLGLTLPVALAFGAYLLSSTPLVDADPLPIPRSGGNGLIGNPGFVLPDEDQGPAEVKPSATPTGGREDVSGNCDEAEHADDPECATGSSGSGTSGSGTSGTSGDDRSGSDDSSGSNSGSGSSNSGSGSGSSGSGSSGSDSGDSSGSGGGDSSGSGGGDSSGSGGGDSSGSGGSDDSGSGEDD